MKISCFTVSQVWNLDNVQEQVHAIPRLSKPVDQLSVTDDGLVALAATRAGVSLWSIPDGRLVRFIPAAGNSSNQHGLAGVKVILLETMKN